MKEQMTAITNPNISVPVTIFSIFADNLPTILNIASFIYLVLLISHKSYQMYKEWKTKSESSK